MRTVKSTLLVLAIVAGAAQVTLAQVNNALSVGKDITNGKSLTWNESYKAAHPNDVFGHVYGRRMLRELLNLPGLQGVYIFNGLGQDGITKLIFKASDSNRNVLQNGIAFDTGFPCPPYCPKGEDNIENIGGQIDEYKAQQWIENFQITYTRAPQAILFTKENLERILAQKDAAGIYFGNAINDKGQQTMVLAGIEANGNIMWTGVTVNNGIPSSPSGYPSRAIALKK
ncbi:MAG: hypothetical protein ACOYXT_29330 [Bacteroidota bacterium]